MNNNPIHTIKHLVCKLEDDLKNCCTSTNVDITSLQNQVTNLQNQVSQFLADDQTAHEVLTTTVISSFPVGTDVQTILNSLQAQINNLHPAASLNSTNAPFSWNGTTQVGNIPLAGVLVNNNNGTATFTAGNGTPPVTIPIGGITVVDNNDGTYIFTLPNGTNITIKDTSISTLVKNNDGTYTYTDETGLSTIFASAIVDDCTISKKANGELELKPTLFDTEVSLTKPVTAFDANKYNQKSEVIIKGCKIEVYNNNDSTGQVIGSDILDTNGAVLFTAGTTLQTVLESLAATCSFKINAGTTNVSTDNSLGEEIISCGDTIHFYSSDGSVNFNVTQGSAVIDIIVPDITNLKNKERPWTKLGDLQSTNNESVLVTDDIYHIGKINEGADFISNPIPINYQTQVIGNHITSNMDRADYFFGNKIPVNVNIDPINGVDGLDPSLYPNQSFKTGTAALTWINSIEASAFRLFAVNSTALDPVLLNTFTVSYNKYLSFRNGFWKVNGSNAFVGCQIYFIALTLETDSNFEFVVNSSIVFANQCTFEHKGTQSLFNIGQHTNIYLAASIINFRANNQFLFLINGSPTSILNISQSGGISSVINDNGFSNLSILRPIDIGDPVPFYTNEAQTIPISVSTAGLQIYRGRTLILKSNMYDNTDVNFAAVFGSQTPQRYSEILTAPEMVSTNKHLVVDNLGVVGWKTELTAVSIDGSETKIQQGTNVAITGVGTTVNPYIINFLETPFTATDGNSIDFTTNGATNHSLTGEIQGFSTANTGQIPSKNSTGTITWITPSTGSTGITGITTKEEGSVIGNTDSITSLNFVGKLITATNIGNETTITVKKPIITQNTDYILNGLLDHTVVFLAGNATLPTPIVGEILVIKNLHSDLSNMTITGNMDNLTNQVLTIAYKKAIWFHGTNTTWVEIA